MNFRVHVFLCILVLICYDVNGDLENESQKFHRLSRRLVGGKNAYPGQVTYIANLRYWGDHFCGGTIIDAQWILTAAHCLELEYKRPRRDKITVAVGTIYSDIDSGDEDNSTTEVEYKVSKIIKHPEYRYVIEHQYNDIGLIKLETPMNFTKAIQPIKLGRIEDNNVPVFVSGWGRMARNRMPDILQQSIMNTMNITVCQKIHDEANNIVDGEKQICVTGGSGKSLCDGDSGSPVIRIDTGRLVGIFIGYEDCAGHYPTLSVRVSAYADWLRNVTGLELPLD